MGIRDISGDYLRVMVFIYLFGMFLLDLATSPALICTHGWMLKGLGFMVKYFVVRALVKFFACDMYVGKYVISGPPIIFSYVFLPPYV